MRSAELCNGRDDDCDGEVDEDAEDAVRYSADHDGDGYGEGSFRACPPVESAAEGGDCDDDNAAAHPGAEEVCNGIDDNCVDGTDEAGTADCVLRYVDSDGDGYGQGEICACAATPWTAALGGDCDDLNPAFTVPCGADYVQSLRPVTELTGLTESIDAVGDIDGDGIPELVTGASVVAFPLAGSRTAGDSIVGSLPAPMNYPGVVADFDGDGLSDLLQTDVPPGDCTYDEGLEPYCDVTFEFTVFPGPLIGELAGRAPFRSVTLGALTYGDLVYSGESDLDGDGDRDVLVSEIDWVGATTWYVADADGTDPAVFTSADSLGKGGCDYDCEAHVGDLNADGVDDLIAGGSIFKGPLTSGLLSGWGVTVWGLGLYVNHVADLDGDGIPELVYASSAGSVEIASIPAEDADWTDVYLGRLLLPAGCTRYSLSLVGDIDEDGADELVFLLDFDDHHSEIAVWSGPIVGEQELATARTVWRFDGSLGVSPVAISETDGAVGIAWSIRGASTFNVSFIRPG